VNFEMQLDAVIECARRFTGRPSFSEPRDALGGRNRAILEMHLEGIIV